MEGKRKIMDKSGDPGPGGLGITLREALAPAAVIAAGAALLRASPSQAGQIVVNVGTEPAFAPFEYTDEET